MDLSQYQLHVYDRAMGAALRMASRRQYGLTPDDAPDIRSEVATRVLAKPFDAKRAPGRAWAIMLIEQQVATYVASRSNAKRDWRTPVVSIDTHRVAQKTASAGHDLMAMDVRMALGRLRPADREAAEAILDGRAESLPRSAKRRMARIMAGLAKYVRG